MVENPLSTSTLQLLFNQIDVHRYPRLRKLTLSSIPIAYSAMICLASAIRHRMLRQLTSLNLSNCSLSTELLQVLSGAVLDEPLQRLKFLSLAKNQIKKKGMLPFCCSGDVCHH